MSWNPTRSWMSGIRLRLSNIAHKKIVWKFNPSEAPHFGGIWERLVQSCKKVTISLLENRRFIDEALNTTMCLVAQTVNARPLPAVSDDPEDLTALHQIISCADKRMRELLSGNPVNAVIAWKNPWKRPKHMPTWSEKDGLECFPQWNQRSNWSEEHVRNLKEGELAWPVDVSVRRWKYKLGWINDIYTGHDGVVRSARVRMAHGELNRPVVKLAPVFYEGVCEIEIRSANVGAT